MSNGIDGIPSNSETGNLQGHTEERSLYKRSRGYHKCPECNLRTLVLIHRRSIDRMINRIYPIRRYRCRNPECHWEGNVASVEGRKDVLKLWQMLLWGLVTAVLITVFWFSLSYILSADR